MLSTPSRGTIVRWPDAERHNRSAHPLRGHTVKRPISERLNHTSSKPSLRDHLAARFPHAERLNHKLSNHSFRGRIMRWPDTDRHNHTVLHPGKLCKQHGQHVLREPRGACVMLATSIGGPLDEDFPRLLSTLNALCSRHLWFRVVLNLYDTPASEMGTRMPSTLPVHPSIQFSFEPGFKTMMWRHVLEPSQMHLKAYSHVWLVDSDMDFHPDRFDAITFVRVSELTNVSILAPSSYGSGNGMYSMDVPRCLQHPRRSLCDRICAQNPMRRCSVCRQPVVEVKAPLFKATAWRAVHQHLLSLIPERALAKCDNIDKHWCNLMMHYDQGCDYFRSPGHCTHAVGQSCAYSYVTPIRHLNIRTSFVCNSTLFNGDELAAWMRSHLAAYRMMPSWRPKGSLLYKDGCITSSRLESSTIMQGWTLPTWLEMFDWRRASDRDFLRKDNAVRICANEYCTGPGSPLAAEPPPSPRPVKSRPAAASYSAAPSGL